MPAYYVISSQETSTLASNAPTSAQINNALDSVYLSGARWVNPRTRIVRWSLGPLSSNITSAARLLEIDDPTMVSGVSNPSIANDTAALYIANEVQAALAPTSGFWSVPNAASQEDALNGPVSWWASGASDVTQTENSFPGIIGGITAAQENPIGPTTNATHPPGLPDLLQAATPWAIWIALGGAALLLLIYAPEIKAFAPKPQRQAPRAAPARAERISTRRQLPSGRRRSQR